MLVPGRNRRSVKLGPLDVLSLGLLGALGAIALFVPWFSTEGIQEVHLDRALRLPVFLGGDAGNPLGTNRLGKDVLLQLGEGLRVSALVGVIAVFLSGALGLVAGMVAGYRGGWFDRIISRLIEAQMALPLLMLALILVVALGASITTIVIAIALNGWVVFARLVRSEVARLKNLDFVVLAEVAGVRRPIILLRHLLPNVLPAALVLATQQFSLAVMEEATLSFLGVGIQPPNTSLGTMVSESLSLLGQQPWLPLVPVVVLVLLALALNTLGDRVREALDIGR